MKRAAYFMAAVMAGMIFCEGIRAQSDSGEVPQNVFDAMKESFRPEKAKGVHIRYQWELSGPDGGEWWITVNDGKYEMGRGRIDNPDVVFIASDKNWVELSNGDLSGTWAFFTGRLKVRGSRSFARKLDEIFP